MMQVGQQTDSRDTNQKHVLFSEHEKPLENLEILEMQLAKGISPSNVLMPGKIRR